MVWRWDSAGTIAPGSQVVIKCRRPSDLRCGRDLPTTAHADRWHRGGGGARLEADPGGGFAGPGDSAGLRGDHRQPREIQPGPTGPAREGRVVDIGKPPSKPT